MLSLYSTELWILLGCICLLIEFTKLPGIGLLFIGLGCFTNAVLIDKYEIYPILREYQYASVGLWSFFWLVILWWPLKRYNYRKNKHPEYFDMIGNEVEVYGDVLSAEEVGKVKWSGTIMNAKLNSDELDEAKVGEKLYIRQIHGNILICSKKPITH